MRKKLKIIGLTLGGLFALLLACASINLKADQTIGGTALNLLAPSLVLFLILIISQQNVLNIDSMYSSADLFMLSQEDFGLGTKREKPLGVIGNILFNKVFLTTIYAIVLYVVLSIILYKTKLGLRLRSCGEHPQVAASLGINVYKMRYIGTIISGCLAAFGVLKCISVGYQYIDFNGDGVYALANLGISSHIYRILPYVITLVVLAFTSKKSRAPKAKGQPYDKEQR